MSFDLFLQHFGNAETTGISRAAVRSLFPVIEEESQQDFWRVRYDRGNSCSISVTALESNQDMLTFLCIERPCGELRFWQSILKVLQMASVVLLWPGSPPILAEGTPLETLPPEMVDSLGEPKIVNTTESILALLRET